MAEDDRKTELMAELESARRRVTVNFRGLRRDLDLPTRAKRAFTRQPLAWIGRRAVEILISIIQGSLAPDYCEIVAPELVVRGSTARPQK